MESEAVRGNYSARTDPRVMLGYPVFNSVDGHTITYAIISPTSHRLNRLAQYKH